LYSPLSDWRGLAGPARDITDNTNQLARCAYAAAMPLTAPAWIAAAAAVVLAIGAGITAWFAARGSGSRQRQHADLYGRLTQLLDLQASELRQAMDERRRAQASQIFIELDRTAAPASEPDSWRVTASVHNTSRQPVYDLYVIWQHGTVRMGKPDPATRLMPGQQLRCERGSESITADAAVDPAALSAFLTFRDSAGTRWTVREDGTFTDIAPAP
jgi:hypothetical protein